MQHGRRRRDGFVTLRCFINVVGFSTLPRSVHRLDEAGNVLVSMRIGPAGFATLRRCGNTHSRSCGNWNIESCRRIPRAYCVYHNTKSDSTGISIEVPGGPHFQNLRRLKSRAVGSHHKRKSKTNARVICVLRYLLSAYWTTYPESVHMVQLPCT